MLMDAFAPDTTRQELSFTSPAAPRVSFHRLSVVPKDSATVRARLAFVHGYGDHVSRYLDAMTWLASRGVACHGVDLRGHGHSSGRRGYVRRWDDYLDDLAALLSLDDLQPNPNLPPLFVLGHSHGGLIVAVAGVRGLLDPLGVRGCILSAPYFVNAHAVPRVKVAGARIANVLCPRLHVSSGLEPEMMTSDAEMIEQDRRDPLLLHCATPRWFFTHRLAQLEAMRDARRFTTPVLILQGEADPIADPRGARAFHDVAMSADKTLITYPGLRHEPLREAARHRVFGDALEWIVQRVSESAPVAPTANTG